MESNSNYVVGIDAGGTKVAYGLFDSRGVIIDRAQHPTDAEADGPMLCDTLTANIITMMEKNSLTFDCLSGIGIGMPSFIFYDEGRIFLTSAIPGIKDFPMRDYLEKSLPARIVLDNDSNAAALAEYRRGAGRGVRHMVYITVGTGLGSGIIIDGKLFRGSYGWAGECGHMLATPDAGMMCGCENRGCYMSYASGKFLPALVKQGLDNEIHSTLTPETMDGPGIKTAFDASDPLACTVVEQIAHNIAVCVFNVYQMLNINTFVFGGGLVGFGEALLGKVYKEFDKYNKIALPVTFKIAELEKDVGIIGAAEFVKGES